MKASFVDFGVVVRKFRARYLQMFGDRFNSLNSVIPYKPTSTRKYLKH
jgi:hypothetical protein